MSGLGAIWRYCSGDSQLPIPVEFRANLLNSLLVCRSEAVHHAYILQPHWARFADVRERPKPGKLLVFVHQRTSANDLE